MISKIIPSGQSLIREVRVHLPAEGKDFSGSLVVFPGKRPSHFLRKTLATEIGSSFIPPVVHSIDQFIDYLCEKSGPLRNIETIDAVAILHDIHRRAATPIGGGGFVTPDSFFSLGLQIYKSIEELKIEGVNSYMVKGIESYVTESIPEQTRERFQSLNYFYEEFYREIGQLGFSSRSSRYQVAALTIDEAQLDRYGKVILAGFFALTNAEKMLFRKIKAFDNAVFIFQDGAGLKEQLETIGIDYDSPDKDRGEPLIHFYSSPDSHGQVLALGKVLEMGLEEGVVLDENNVIVLPSSETLFPLLRQGLSSFPEETYNVSLGYPLHRTPVFGFLNNLMELVASMDEDRLYIPDYLKFALHPYTKNIYYRGTSETTRILFHSIEEGLLRHKSKTFTTLAEIEGNDVLFRDAVGRLPKDEIDIKGDHLRGHLKDIHRCTIVGFLSFKNIGEFAMKCKDVLIYIFNNSTARLHPLFYPFSDSFVSALDTLMLSRMKDTAFVDRASYFAFFRKYIMTFQTPFSGTPLNGLQVLGSLETRNLKFERVFMLDANEDVIPNTNKEDTLLPFKAREILGLPTYVDKDRLASYYFDTLLRGSREVHLFFVENDKSERSRFVEKLLWEKQQKDKVTDVRPYISAVQYRVRLANCLPDAIPKSLEISAFLRGVQYNATLLNQYLKCPLQFYYARVLGFSSKNEITGSIERDDLGSFVHSALRKYFSDKMGKELAKDDLAVQQMDEIIEHLFDEEYGEEPSGALYLLKRQIKKQMATVLRDYYVPLIGRQALTIIAMERAIDVRVESFKLTGRLDSVERRGDKTVIIDFKTGANQNYLRINMDKLDLDKRETWAAAIGSLQLPFYLLLYSEKEKMPINELDALFLLFGRSVVSNEIELPFFGVSSSTSSYTTLHELIMRLLREITDPSIPFGPPADRKRACPKCDFNYVCGTQWIVK